MRVSVQVTKWADFVPALNQQCIVLTPFCNETKWEEEVKRMSREEALNGGVEDATTSTRSVKLPPTHAPTWHARRKPERSTTPSLHLP